MNKKLTFLQNLVLFMSLSIERRHVLTFLTMELYYLQSSRDQEFFIAYLLYREVGLPFLILIFVNLIYNTRDWRLRGLYTLLYLSALFRPDLLAKYYHIKTYINWSFFADLIIALLYVLTSFFVTFIIVKLKSREAINGNHL